MRFLVSLMLCTGVGCAATRTAPRTAGDLLKVVREHNDEMKGCYREWLRGGLAEVDVDLNVVVETDGSVSKAQVEGSVPATLATCMVAQARGWRFPEAPTRSEFVAPYKFRLPPKG